MSVQIDFRKAACVLTLLILVATFAYNYYLAVTDARPEYNKELIRPCGDLDAEPPKITAEAAAMYSVDLDEFVYEKNADKKLPPYSVTKILTTYLALENLEPDDVLTASKNAIRPLKDGMELHRAS